MRALMEVLLPRLLEKEATAHLGAEAYERTADRRGHRGRRDEKVRQVIACYVEEIRICPEDKTGELLLNAAAFPSLESPPKENDRPEGRSRVAMVAGGGFEPPTFGL